MSDNWLIINDCDKYTNALSFKIFSKGHWLIHDFHVFIIKICLLTWPIWWKMHICSIPSSNYIIRGNDTFIPFIFPIIGTLKPHSGTFAKSFRMFIRNAFNDTIVLCQCIDNRRISIYRLLSIVSVTCIQLYMYIMYSELQYIQATSNQLYVKHWLHECDMYMYIDLTCRNVF